MSWRVTTQIWVVCLIGENVPQPISSTFRLIIAGSGHKYQNKRSAFNPRLSFNRSYHTDREPVGCSCTCRNIFTQHCSDHSFSFISELWSLLFLLVIFLDFSIDCVSFRLLLLNLISSTFHNQSKNRRQNSSYEKHNTSWWFSILPVVLQLLFSHQWLWNKLYKAILFQFLDCFSLVFFKKDSPLHPRLNKFPGWIDCKATYKAKGSASMLKMLETWRETNAPLWLLIGCIIFPIDMKIQSFTIILIGHIIFFMCLRHC